MDIADKILEQIAHHRAEILRLESALQVFMEIGGGGGKAAKGQQPLITIRKMVPMAQAQLEEPKAAKAKKPQPRPRLQGVEEKRRLREGILEALAQRGRMNSSELIAKFGPKKPDKSDKQVIYAMMYELRNAGIVERDDERYFSLVHQPHQQMATAS